MTDHRRKIDALLADLRHQQRRVEEETEALTEAEAKVVDCLEAQKLVQTVAETVQRKAHERIAAVVTRCLRATFGKDAYEFKIKFEQKRGKTEAVLTFVRDGREIEEPTEAAGGGTVEVAALALRLACISLSRPRARKLLVMDEPLKNLNGTVYQERVARMLEALAEDTGFQFIFVSDDDWLQIGKVVEL